jgi:hypothetical protein
MEIMRWVKLIAALSPLIGLGAVGTFLAIFYRPLSQILKRFNCGDLIRLKIGPLEIERRPRPKHARALRRKRQQSTRQ